MAENQPEDFKLLAQNMRTYELCGLTEQFGLTETKDIPPGFSQRILPGHYGEYLSLNAIVNFALIENGELKSQLNNFDEIAISQYEVSTTQDAGILELYELIGGIVK